MPNKPAAYQPGAALKANHQPTANAKPPAQTTMGARSSAAGASAFAASITTSGQAMSNAFNNIGVGFDGTNLSAVANMDAFVVAAGDTPNLQQVSTSSASYPAAGTAAMHLNANYANGQSYASTATFPPQAGPRAPP